MDRAVAEWERLRAFPQFPRPILLSAMNEIVFDAIRDCDYEFIDNFLIQVEPRDIPTIITALLRSTFRAHRHLITWDQLRDKTWNMDSSEQWRYALRGLEPKNCARYSDFIANGGYAAVREALGV